MKLPRRRFLELGGRTAALAATAAAGLVRWSEAATGWNKTGFESKAMADALKSLGGTNVVESRDIVVTAPDVAENGAVVPVAVTSRIPNTQSISILVQKNPFPLAAIFEVVNGAEGYASVRLKMAETSQVRAVVRADGRFYTAAREVKVTVGGCG